jgi:Right handed beta helix region
MRNDRTARRWWTRLLAATACGLAVTLAASGTALAAPAPAPPSAGSTPDASAAQRAAAQRAATAARAAARAADAAQRARSTWDSHGRPNAMVIIRPTGIDLVSQGRLTRRIPRGGSALTLAALGRYLPTNWLTINGSTAKLSAAVVVTPGIELDVAAPVTTLQLAGGATAADAASLYTGSGRLALTGVTVTSFDRTSGQPMQPGAGRPFVLVSPAGRFTATDSTINNLGTAPADSSEQVQAGGDDHAAVEFHTGSTGSLVRTSVVGGGTGLQLDGTQNVHLEDVTVSGSAGSGIVLRGDRGTTMSGVHADRNGDYGVQVTGPSTDRPVTGVTATGNAGYGIGLDRQTGTKITGAATSGNQTGGLELSQSKDITVSGLTVTDEPIGVFTHVNSTNVVLDQLAVTGGRRGVQIEKTTQTVMLQASTIRDTSVAAISVDGKEVAVRDVAVGNSQTAMRIERGADGVTVTDLKITGGQDGIVASPATSRVVIQDLRAEGMTGAAVRSASPDARIVGGAIAGGSTGIALAAPTTLTGTTINLTDTGIRVESTGLVHADDVDVNAVSVGIDTGGTSPVLLTRSQVHAFEAVRGTVDAEGQNDLSLPPLNLLGAIGIPLIVIAVALQAVAALRGRRYGGDVRRTPPVLPGPDSALQSEPAPAARTDAPAHAA